MWLQVAEVVAACVANEGTSANKTLEVIASDVAPPRTLEEMLVEQPVEITVEELREKQVCMQSMHYITSQPVATEHWKQPPPPPSPRTARTCAPSPVSLTQHNMHTSSI